MGKLYDDWLVLFSVTGGCAIDAQKECVIGKKKVNNFSEHTSTIT